MRAKFQYGDMVTVKETGQKGMIIEIYTNGSKWSYSVRFNDSTGYYDEDELTK